MVELSCCWMRLKSSFPGEPVLSQRTWDEAKQLWPVHGTNNIIKELGILIELEGYVESEDPMRATAVGEKRILGSGN